ncbi:sodium:proton antiporter [Rossellomorea vietnamensis]|uniref:Sodium:proton antiporter n=1 Tax=Rossellomorea vietnamensis TaxID=218284 RepID=A0A5D4MG82_9BACI|nr:Na+/H+ antiporter NhaC family protein [Rossellomorea vietnamensis]TYS00354.1 sodium:proton antiporter [Rossellomorea vietnamensis]
MKSLHFTMRQVLAIIVVTLSGVLLSVSLGIPLFFGFLPGYSTLAILVVLKGAPVKQVLSISWNGVKKTRGVIYILLLVSFLLPSWYISGAIQQLVSLALYLITPEHFYFLSFLISLVFSMILGTSVGTLSAVGIPIMSSALTLDLAPAITAGALVSGAFVGDRTSPFSSSHQLLSHTVEVGAGKQFVKFLPTTIAAITICAVFYMVMDSERHYWTTVFINEVFDRETISMIKFLPPFILLAFVVLRVNILYAFIGSVLTASFIALLDGIRIGSILKALWFGADEIGGGLSSMYFLLLFLALAGAYNGIMEGYRIIQPLLDRWLRESKGLFYDSFKTILATLVISLISANQTLPIILTGRSFLSHWGNRYNKSELARVMGDSTMLFPGMIPWSVLAIMCSTILGVPILSYLPYAVFLWILPILTMLLSIFKQSRTVNKLEAESSN